MLSYSGEELLQSCPSGLDKLLVESVESLQTMFLRQRLGERRCKINSKFLQDNSWQINSNFHWTIHKIIINSNFTG